jgi:LPXTG-motif cell wall-anchored protein
MKLLRRLAVAVSLAAATVPFVSGTTHADVPVFSATASCTDNVNEPRHIVVTFGGSEGQQFDLFIDDQQVAMVYNYGDGTGLPLLTDGSHHVVVKLTGTEQVVFEKTVYVGCEFPYITYAGECRDDGGHLLLLIEQNQGYTFNAYVDDELVDGFEHITDTDGGFADLGQFANGQHFVMVTWFDGPTDIDDSGGNVTLNCEDTGSGAGIPDTGADTWPLLAVGGAALVLGAALLALRRIRIA